MLISGRIGHAAGAPQACRATDEMFAEHPEPRAPERADYRSHEGLVVEARRKQFANELVDRADVPGKRGKPVLALSHEAVMNLDHGGWNVRIAHLAPQDCDQGVRLVHACRKHAAGSMVFERTAERTYAIGQQRGSQRVAGIAAIGNSIEGETDGARAVDAPPSRLRAAGTHDFDPWCREAGGPPRAGLVSLISCVSGLRPP